MPADTKQIVLKDIGAKWSKFSEQELGALKNNDELVSQVVAKYSIGQAQRDVDALMKGREINHEIGAAYLRPRSSQDVTATERGGR